MWQKSVPQGQKSADLLELCGATGWSTRLSLGEERANNNRVLGGFYLVLGSDDKICSL
jgi:hypothetical protein